MKYRTPFADGAFFGCLGFAILLAVTSVAAWATHVITCIQHHEWGFLVAGAIAAPVAVVHGFGIWFGMWH